MLKPFLTEICQRALGISFSPYVLHTISAAIRAQDSLRCQIGHPEFHFDENAFESRYTYMESQRQIICSSVCISGEMEPAWKAFRSLNISNISPYTSPFAPIKEYECNSCAKFPYTNLNYTIN